MYISSGLALTRLVWPPFIFISVKVAPPLSSRFGRKTWKDGPRDAKILSSYETVNSSDLAVFVCF